jgi:hypothetical protein
LGYTISESVVQVQFLKNRKAIPLGISIKEAKLVYQNPLGLDIVILEMDSLPTRKQAARIARYWKEHQAGRQLMIFTNGEESYTTVIPGPVENNDKLRMLSLSEKLYRTDEEALESLRFTDDEKELRDRYDKNFLPYEKIRDEFFEKYRDLFASVVKTVRPIIEDNSNDYAQRFLGRLMFLYFLQKKGWLKGNKKFIDTIEDYQSLNSVFYKSLNTEGGDLPFLDGTLFEREPYLTDEAEKNLENEMNSIFRDARDLFNQYNFTVDELTPKEVEVSLDPSLIGTIFENMLPENERGGKGVFYTPPEETSFICRRALAAYLKIPEPIEKDGKTDGEKLRDGLESIIQKLKDKKSEKSVRDLRDQILSITVLDPAVGSGGFLLGMMQEMINLLREADETVGWNSDIDEYKKRILENLFGFDIEDEAIEIARLRLWLSMIVDKKEAEPLLNLDMNIVKISDSLIKPGGIQRKLDTESEIWERMYGIRKKFFSAKTLEERRRLRKELQDIRGELKNKWHVENGIIESWVPKKVDIVVMNPPYIRQEYIPPEKKKYYSITYHLSKKSDIYCYFILRSAELINYRGIVSVISSDKWLEADYGSSLQKWISSRLISVFGQRERTFKAEVNSVIYVFGSHTDSQLTTDFVSFDQYSSLNVRKYKRFLRKDLKAGKWFYLRAPKMFMEKIFPKLDHKLGDFAEINFGLKTGANEFFYMKDLSSMYEADYLSNPKKFEDWGVTAKNEKELKNKGLIYVENNAKERFVIDSKDTSPIIKSPKQFTKYILSYTNTICLYTTDPGEFTKKYIQYGESKRINSRPTLANRKLWYSLPNLQPAKIFLVGIPMDRLFAGITDKPSLCDATLYATYVGSTNWVPFLNSTIFYMIMELYSRRMGGGTAEIKVIDYIKMPVPDLSKLSFEKDEPMLRREVKHYYEEVKTTDRRDLDMRVFNMLNIKDVDIEEFYSEYVELVDDRIIKSGRTLKSREGEIEQDN